MSRRAALALTVVGLLASAVAASAGAPAPTARAAFIGPYTGVGTGLLDRYHHMDDLESGADHFFSDSKDVYKARFTYSFRIENDGTVAGTGSGTYESATWHLSGQNEDKGSFDCDIPMTTTPFGVNVTGSAADGTVKLRFELTGATETNSDYDCGADYTGFATESTYLADSLATVQPPDGVAVDQTEPAIPPLRKLEQTGDERDSRVILHEWTITITPPEPPDVSHGGGPGPGTAHKPSDPGTAICTVMGTARADRLQGTPGDDVICGFGGGDRIRGKGGNDILYGSFGADRLKGGKGRDAIYGNNGRYALAAKDSAKDIVDGGRGKDRARVDKGVDAVRKVEKLL